MKTKEQRETAVREWLYNKGECPFEDPEITAAEGAFWVDNGRLPTCEGDLREIINKYCRRVRLK